MIIANIKLRKYDNSLSSPPLIYHNIFSIRLIIKILLISNAGVNLYFFLHSIYKEYIKILRLKSKENLVDASYQCCSNCGSLPFSTLRRIYLEPLKHSKALLFLKFLSFY